MNKTITAVVITAIIAGGAGFYGGNVYGKSANPRSGFNRMDAGVIGMMGQRGNGMQQNADFSGGEILKKDDQSITVKLKDGSSKIIFLSSSTKILKTVQGLINDLTIGEQVTVSGSKNQDGSITAQSIQIRPALPAGK